ncbi:MAG: ABC transporter substrate-binding protein [Methanomassiliicoccaceae archaeon]|nr:ABC transporter substrate-binding protein [Methanomassiliicoccaceae archaeon]
MNTKQLVVISVVVLVIVAGVGVFFLLGDGNDHYRSKDTTGRLMIHGNANNDDYLDKEDIDTLQSIIDEGFWGKEKYPFADANQDGVIDQKDIDMVRKMINHESMTVFFNDGSGNLQSIKYPIGNVVAYGVVDVYIALLCIGGIDRVVGVAPTYSNDPVLFGEMAYKPKISSAATTIQIELFSELTKSVKVDAIISSGHDSVVNPQFSEAGYQILGFGLGMSDGRIYSCGLLTLGYLMNLEEPSQKFVRFADSILDTIEEKTGSLSDSERVTILAALNGGGLNVSGPGHVDSNVAVGAGGKNLADWGAFVKPFIKGDEWIYNYNPQVITVRQALGYGELNMQTIWDNNCKPFSGMNAYGEGKVYYINGTMPTCIRMAYMATAYYPDLFDADYGVKCHQQFIDDFVPHLSGKFDVTKDGVFFITSDMVNT